MMEVSVHSVLDQDRNYDALSVVPTKEEFAAVQLMEVSCLRTFILFLRRGCDFFLGSNLGGN